jgi:hypothetical protein
MRIRQINKLLILSLEVENCKEKEKRKQSISGHHNNKGILLTLGIYIWMNQIQIVSSPPTSG